MTTQRRNEETMMRTVMVGALLAFLAALAPGCDGDETAAPVQATAAPIASGTISGPAPTVDEYDCTLTREQETGTATITAATASAPECEPWTIPLVGCTLSVVGGDVAAGVPMELTGVSQHGACVFALAGRATLQPLPECTITVALTMTVRRG